MSEREELESAVAALEGQRSVLGDSAVDAALAGLRQKLSALDGGQSPPTEEVITHLMPRALADKMQATRHVQGERKQVTVLFADLSGYTSLSERLDPEVVMNLSKDLLEELTESVYEHEGYVAQFMGDSVMAVFGAPITHEDDAERAVHAALGMHQRIDTLSRRWMGPLGQTLTLHTGINTGTAVTGNVGSDLRMDYAVIGDTTNTAQRLQSAAAPGEILVSRETYVLTSHAFTFVALEPMVVKGKREPVPAYRVIGLKTRPGRRRGLHEQGLVSPLIGRQEELNLLLSHVRRLHEHGEGGTVGIIGDAGLGKSRLVAETRSIAAANSPDVTWLEGQTLSFGRTISYWPFQQILRNWADITEDDDSDASWSKLEKHMRGLFGQETIDYLPYLASLLALEVRDEYAERVKYLDGEAMGKQIFLAARRFFERLARILPTVLVFEDLHWMDESSANLLEHLLPLVETVPLLILGLSRPDRETAAARLREHLTHDFAERYAEIQLTPLSHGDSGELLQNLLATEDFPASLRALIVQRAEGNPFFLEEVIRTLIGTGAVLRDAATEKWRATAATESIRIPNTIQGVIMARVDRLDDEVKQVLRIASVIGRSFLYRLLKGLEEAGHRLDDNLTELQATELIREKRHQPELEYMFRHAVTQEATYESILLEKRRELHARVGQAIESIFAGRLEEFYGLLAYHYARAEAPAKLREYLLKAADQAGQIAADAEALNLYEQAIAASVSAFGDNWDPVQRAALERKVGEARHRLGDHAQAIEHFYRALDYLDAPFPRSPGGVRRAIVQEVLQQAGNRLLPSVFLKKTTALVAGTFEQELHCYVGITEIVAYTNPEAYVLATVRALNRSEQSGSSLGAGLYCAVLGNVLDFARAYPIAEAYHRRAIAVAQQLHNPRITEAAQSLMSIHECILGNLGPGFEHATRAVAAAQESGELHRWGFSAMLVGEDLNCRGDLRRAVDQGIELVRIGQEAGARQLECFGEMVQGGAQLRSGVLDEARRHLERAVALAAQLPNYYVGVRTSGELAQCRARQGELESALEVLDSGEQLRAKYKIGGDSYSSLLHGEAECYLLEAERASQLERAVWLRKARHACQAGLKQVKAYRLGAPEAMLWQGRYEWLRGEPDAARTWWARSAAEAERMGMRWDEAMAHTEIGERLRDRKDLEHAKTIFEEIGAEHYSTRVDQLLRGAPAGR